MMENYRIFLLTKALPPIYYLPSSHNEKTQELLNHHRQEILDKIKQGNLIEKSDSWTETSRERQKERSKNRRDGDRDDRAERDDERRDREKEDVVKKEHENHKEDEKKDDEKKDDEKKDEKKRRKQF